MPTGLTVAVAFVVLVVLLPAALGLVLERARGNRPRGETLMRADKARARATLAYFNDVHDSHSG